MKRYRIAVIPGDGVGKEVIPAGQRVLEAAVAGHAELAWTEFPWGYDYYRRHPHSGHRRGDGGIQCQSSLAVSHSCPRLSNPPRSRLCPARRSSLRMKLC